MHRRLFVATAAGAITATAGCLDVFDDVTSFSASPAIVADEQAETAGYVYQGTDETVETETVPETDETIEVTNYASEYTRTIELSAEILDIDDPEVGVFAVVTTPQVSVAGQEYNPIDDRSNAELAGMVQDQYDEISIGDSIGTRSVSGLETTIDVETFDAEARLLGEQSIDVRMDIGQFDHDDDHVVIVGGYPDDSDLPLTDEESRIETMIGGLEHGDDVDAEIDRADE